MRQSLKYFPYISAVILAALILRLLLQGLSWVGIVALVVSVAWFGFEIVQWLVGIRDHAAFSSRKGKNSEPGEEPEPLISLVYFLSESREPEEKTIRNCVASALEVDFKENDQTAEYFVLQFTPQQFEDSPTHPVQHYMIRIPQGLFSVLVSDSPYITDPKTFAKDSIRDKRLRSAVENHQAWLSVDLMDEGDQDSETVAQAYSVIGKILAAMAGPDCLAIYCPELQRCNEFDLSLMETLASGTPLQIFDEPTFEPIIEVSDNDPRMAAAVKEAIERWPEFIDAFQNRIDRDSEKFIIKAEFSEDSVSEYMWMTVNSIKGDVIQGVLMNDPHELIEVHRGAGVTVSFKDLNDWIFPGADNTPVGGFTLDVLTDDEN